MLRTLHQRAIVLPGGKIEIVDESLPVGETVDVDVIVKTLEPAATGRSILEILNSGPDRRLFQTAEEVEAYLAEEKASWER